jgi:NADPH:quinone reductase-like Zn-dependent oxidoreductase
MKAAVIRSFDSPPRCEDVPIPEPAGAHEVLVDVLAAGLHPRVRSQADGSHYTSTGALPLVPGIDGVGRDADGALHYFLLPDTTMGTMADHTLIDIRRSVPLPAGTDPIAVAAGINPAMSAWIALRRRIEFVEGAAVLVLGATGSAGRLAIQVARHLGAGRVVAAGRDPDRLAGLTDLGADVAVPLGTEAFGKTAADVDVVLDYLWGDSAAAAMVSIITGRRDRGRALHWVQIGSVAGPIAPIPSAALRASRLTIVGSGQGSVSTGDILAELPALAHAISAGTFGVDAEVMELADVERAWAQAGRTSRRIVLVP